MTVLKNLFKPPFLAFEKKNQKKHTKMTQIFHLQKNEAILEKSTKQNACGFWNSVDMWKRICFKFLYRAKNLHRRFVKVEPGSKAEILS